MTHNAASDQATSRSKSLPRLVHFFWITALVFSVAAADGTGTGDMALPKPQVAQAGGR